MRARPLLAIAAPVTGSPSNELTALAGPEWAHCCTLSGPKVSDRGSDQAEQRDRITGGRRGQRRLCRVPLTPVRPMNGPRVARPQRPAG